MLTYFIFLRYSTFSQAPPPGLWPESQHFHLPVILNMLSLGCASESVVTLVYATPQDWHFYLGHDGRGMAALAIWPQAVSLYWLNLLCSLGIWATLRITRRWEKARQDTHCCVAYTVFYLCHHLQVFSVYQASGCCSVSCAEDLAVVSGTNGVVGSCLTPSRGFLCFITVKNCHIYH